MIGHTLLLTLVISIVLMVIGWVVVRLLWFHLVCMLAISCPRIIAITVIVWNIEITFNAVLVIPSFNIFPFRS